jgi:hypothetical protein
MGDVVDLKLAPLIDNQDFISDMCRFQEGIVTEKAIRKKYRFDEAAWEKLNDDELVRAIEAESVRRIRDGSAKREKSQKLVVAAPDVLSGILLDNTANARHRIDSCKVLNDFCNGPGDTTLASDRFIINIVLNSDNSGGEPAALHFNKSIRPLEPGEIDPDDSSPDTAQGVIAALAAKKTTENGGGCESI